jgi:hypothetical protein
MSSLLDLEGKNALLTGAVLYGRVNGKIAPVFRDPVLPALLTENIIDYKINTGEHFRFNHYLLIDENEAFYFIIETNNQNKCNLKIRCLGDFHTRVELFEDTTHTSGTPQTTINSNRNSGKVSYTKIYASDGTGGVNGNLIETLDFGERTDLGITIPAYQGGDVEVEKIELKTSAKYLIKVLSLSDDNFMRLRLSWYENLEI